ncbi:hypothetical protein [Micromonospora okii]|uniref:hypothetical protein n=1 Tax=Micromonospora okii TaxID=1182970 RepID=UPI001E3F1EFB|nr:hypothetical protein [Micromonospora okii]
MTDMAAEAAFALDLSSGNHRAPLTGLYDWRRAGYRGCAALPGNDQLNPGAACQVTSAELADIFEVHPGHGLDDSAGRRPSTRFGRSPQLPC